MKKKCFDDGVLEGPEFRDTSLKLVFVGSSLNSAHFILFYFVCFFFNSTHFKASIFPFMFEESAILVSMGWRFFSFFFIRSTRNLSEKQCYSF